MKKIILISLFFTFKMTAQVTESNPETGSKWGGYAAVSVSVTNSDDFALSSYFSVEGGITKENISLGLAVGRSSLGDRSEILLDGEIPAKEKDLWFAEPKAQFVVLNYGLVRGYVMTGIGAYPLRDDVAFFIEYGGGALLSLTDGLDMGFQFSNWDGINYVSLGVAKSF